ncbi:unnamed protein product [Cunninghamella blakesleeana]
MTGVMDIKNILCHPLDNNQPEKNNDIIQQDPFELNPHTTFIQPYQENDDYWKHTRSTSTSSFSSGSCTTSGRSSRSNSISSLNNHLNEGNGMNNNGSGNNGIGGDLSPYSITSPRRRVYSENYRTTPLFTYAYHYPQHHPQQDHPYIMPLKPSMSTNMISSSTSYQRQRNLSISSSSSSSVASSPTSSPVSVSSSTATTNSNSNSNNNNSNNSGTSNMTIVNQIQTRTPWTPMEDELLQKGYEQGLSWAMISATYLPHRSRGCCWGRFKTLQSKNLVDIKFQHQTRLARRAWKTMDIKKKSSV